MHYGISEEAMFSAVPVGCYLPVHFQAGGNLAITMLGQKQVVYSGLVNFCHELNLSHGCSE